MSCPQGAFFFSLPESIQLLLLASPEPALLATLLRLSKRLRCLIWDFLVDPMRGGTEWIRAFALRGWPLFQTEPFWLVEKPAAGYPFFVVSTQGAHRGLVLARFRIAGTSVGEIIVADEARSGSVSWFTRYVDATTIVLDWYFVACALTHRLDAVLMAEARQRRRGGIVSEADANLVLL